MSPQEQPELHRRLGLADAVTIGLGSMIGAGIFVALGPAAAAAGSWLLVGLAAAAVVAYCNATSSARLAALYPHSGGAYLYGRERLGDFWGHLAGWSFVVGKIASCAAMALTVGVYIWAANPHAVAVAAVATLTAVNYRGIEKSAALNRVIVAIVLAVLAGVVIVGLSSGDVEPGRLNPGSGNGAAGVLQAAALLFFAFAGYARIATLGEEVRDPARTIPRAIAISFGLALVIYTLVAVVAVTVLGATALAHSPAPLVDVVASLPGFEPVVRVGAAVAALGSLLSLILGGSRPPLAKARDGHLPSGLAAVHVRFGVPHRAELAVGAVVAVVAASADVRGVIGFSSFAVLVYYAVANASAITLGRRLIPIAGLVGCTLLAAALPIASIVVGVSVLTLGAGAYALHRLC